MPSKDKNKLYKDFRTSYISRLKELEKDYDQAWLDVTLYGNEENLEILDQSENRLADLYKSKKDYRKLISIKKSEQIKDSKLNRCLKSTIKEFEYCQSPLPLRYKAGNIQNKLKFYSDTQRAYLKNGNCLSEEFISNVFENSKSSILRKDTWNALKNITINIKDDFLELIQIRNKIAISLGYKNFYEMELIDDDLDPTEVKKIFNDLDVETSSEFEKAKSNLDDVLSKTFNIPPDRLMPWHYSDPFFQRYPSTKVNIDSFFKSNEKDYLVNIAKKYYQSIKMPWISKAIKNSDLYERENKTTDAFCCNIGRCRDVSIIANLNNSEYAMSTLLHELSHAAYLMNLDFSLPYELTKSSHALIDEGIAQIFEALTSNVQWLKTYCKDIEIDNEAIEQINSRNRLNELIEILIIYGGIW
jgi:peptidyl-dipeptidase A